MKLLHRNILIGDSKDYLEFTFVIINILLLIIFIPIKSLLIFYFVSLILITARARLGISIIVLTLALLYFRSSPVIFDGPLVYLLKNYSGRLSALFFPVHTISAIGISYCYIRVIYALYEGTMGIYDFTRYYFFFPTYISGPIFNSKEFLSQRIKIDKKAVSRGIKRVAYGLMKFTISLFLQLLVPLSSEDNMRLAIEHDSIILLWLGVVFAGIWIYLNFSGFSDIAIGIGRIIGYRVPENFSNPYKTCNLTNFWRSWHITLGDWLRSIIYNPLIRKFKKQFSEKSFVIIVVPIIITMIICGLWHGITLSFFIWGIFHGVGIAVHQLWLLLVRPNLPESFKQAKWYVFITWFVTHFYVSIGWVFFFPVHTQSLTLSSKFILRMFGID